MALSISDSLAVFVTFSSFAAFSASSAAVIFLSATFRYSWMLSFS